MSRLPVDTQVLSAHGQAGVVVPRNTSMWPTLTPVRWVGTQFVTYVDHHKLEVVVLPAGDVKLTADSKVRRVAADPGRRDKAVCDRSALLERARQRGMVRM